MPNWESIHPKMFIILNLELARYMNAAINLNYVTQIELGDIHEIIYICIHKICMYWDLELLQAIQLWSGVFW